MAKALSHNLCLPWYSRRLALCMFVSLHTFTPRFITIETHWIGKIIIERLASSHIVILPPCEDAQPPSGSASATALRQAEVQGEGGVGGMEGWRDAEWVSE